MNGVQDERDYLLPVREGAKASRGPPIRYVKRSTGRTLGRWTKDGSGQVARVTMALSAYDVVGTCLSRVTKTVSRVRAVGCKALRRFVSHFNAAHLGVDRYYVRCLDGDRVIGAP